MKTKRRILFVNGNLSIGGTERSLVNLLNAIDTDDYDIDLLLLQPGRELISELKPNINVISRDVTAAFGPIKETVSKNIKDKRYFEIILRICLTLPSKIGSKLLGFIYRQFGIKRKYDVAISYRPGLSELIVLNCVKSNKKLTWWHHGDFSNGVNLLTLRRNWKLFDRVITVSEGIERLIQKTISECVGKTGIIYNLVNTDVLRSKVNPVNPYESWNCSLKLVTVSRLSIEKNLTRIIDIAKELLKQSVYFKWAIVGGGKMQEDLHKLIVDHKLEEYVMLIGETDDPYSWMYYADLMVHPSLIESFGLVLVESMSLGTPCVSAKSLGALDVINDDNGILVDDNSTEYVRAIIHFNENNLFRLKLIENGKKSVEKYTPNKAIRNFYSLIEAK